jgi:hypothetical protein
MKSPFDSDVCSTFDLLQARRDEPPMAGSIEPLMARRDEPLMARMKRMGLRGLDCTDLDSRQNVLNHGAINGG